MNETPFETSEQDLKALPVGTILPFSSDMDLPKNWEKLEGQLIPQKDAPILHDRLKEAQDIWRQIGGQWTPSGMHLPRVKSGEQAQIFVWGKVFTNAEIFVAIKVTV
jgi:hypothetical protein